MSSLPVPVSPWMSTVNSVGAIFASVSRTIDMPWIGRNDAVTFALREFKIASFLPGALDGNRGVQSGCRQCTYLRQQTARGRSLKWLEISRFSR